MDTNLITLSYQEEEISVSSYGRYFREFFPRQAILCAVDSEVVARPFTQAALSYITEKIEQGKKRFLENNPPDLNIKIKTKTQELVNY